MLDDRLDDPVRADRYRRRGDDDREAGQVRCDVARDCFEVLQVRMIGVRLRRRAGRVEVARRDPVIHGLFLRRSSPEAHVDLLDGGAHMFHPAAPVSFRQALVLTC
ncbi:hypothetical protein [Burkholderia sp. BE17]|uniref:hypothetical protein n=1 Tax=Burkholderia sp. BE17 TaxID=2656644 RepID=UPI001D12EF78|nr:hypothetical protein [Burkholderia sp. BE17]